MRQIVLQAFLSTADGYSPDFVIANPDLNRRFLDECRKQGLAEPSLQINSCLLNLRKAGAMTGVKCKRFSVVGQDAFRFGSEIAVQFLERRDHVTLDQILCDPARAAEFDEIAGTIAPGFSAFQYCWAALNLRKRKKLQPEVLGKLVVPDAVEKWKVEELDASQIPLRLVFTCLSGLQACCMLANARICESASPSTSTTPTIRGWPAGFGKTAVTRCTSNIMSCLPVQQLGRGKRLKLS